MEDKHHKETDTEMLARMMASGFGEMRENFAKIDARFDGVDSRLDRVETRLDGVEIRLDSVESRLGSLELGQRNLYRLTESLERKQIGTLESLDETVHHREFYELN